MRNAVSGFASSGAIRAGGRGAIAARPRARIFCQRSARFAAAASKPFSLRAAASGTIVADAKFGGFFDGPFERVEFHDGEQQRCVRTGRLVGRQFFEQRELDAIAADGFDAAEPDALAVAQFVELTRLGAEHAAEVMRRVAFHDGTVPFKLFDKKSPAHARILPYWHA